MMAVIVDFVDVLIFTETSYRRSTTWYNDDQRNTIGPFPTSRPHDNAIKQKELLSTPHSYIVNSNVVVAALPFASYSLGAAKAYDLLSVSVESSSAFAAANNYICQKSESRQAHERY
jgi:hypothetical protein